MTIFAATIQDNNYMKRLCEQPNMGLLCFFICNSSNELTN